MPINRNPEFYDNFFSLQLAHLAFAENSVYIRFTMFFNRYTTLSLPHFGLLLAGLLLRVAR